jgi:hypothetical protein
MIHWLRAYTYSLVVGVFIILIVGIVANQPSSRIGRGSDMEGTGFVAYGTGEVKISGNVYEQKYIVKDCKFSPELVQVSPGDRIKASFAVYDPSGRTHRITISDLNVDVRVRGSEVISAEFIVPKGSYKLEDAYPCKAMGYDTTTTIVAK